MIEIRKNCKYRHDNGNCLRVGGFCLAVSDEHCAKMKEVSRMIHELKTYPKYFEETLKGNKPFECRLDDRGFKVGDIVILREWDNIKYSGREIRGTIKYILDDRFIGIAKGYVIFSLDIKEGEE